MQKLLLLCAIISFEIISAQSHVTKIFTTYNTFWESGLGSSNLIPNNSHDLLAFRVGSTTFSTGVNDALLEQRGVEFEASSYAALPIKASQPPGSGTYIGVGVNYGGVGNVAPIPVNQPFFQYVSDGVRGLDIGSAIFNYPRNSRIGFDVTNINPNSIGDGIPDLLITQMGAIGSVTDQFFFTDEDGNVVGNVYNVSLLGVPSLGTFRWKFYNANVNPPTYNSQVSGGDNTRNVRLLAIDWGSMGLTEENVGQITRFVQVFSGESDFSFIAYNRNSVSLSQFIDGFIFKDANGGIPDGLPFQGVTVSRRNSTGNIVTTTTDAYGYYRFNNIISGTYTIQVTPPTNYSVVGNSNGTTANSLVVNVGNLPAQNRNFGLYRTNPCVKAGTTGAAIGGSEVGILTKSRQSIANWPANVPNGHLVMDSSNKGLVVNHMTTAQRDALTPVEGMVVYNTDLNCVQIYRGNAPGTDYRRVGWNCIVKTCNEE